MIEYIIPLIEAYFSSGFVYFYFVFILGLAFLATVPCIIRYFWRS